GLDAHVTVDDRERRMRDPLAYTELLCGLHPVGTPRLCVDRLAATSERTGISRFALLVEGSGDLAATEGAVRRLGAEALAQGAAGRVTPERTQQLSARLLVRRQRLVGGERTAVDLQLSNEGADHLPCVRQGGPDAVDEFSFVDLASLGLFE